MKEKGGIFIPALVLAFIPVCVMTAQSREDRLDKTQIVELFSKAKSFFWQAQEVSASDPESAKKLYESSILRFERIVRDGGIHNGKLYYNIGNAYFRAGNLGRAILNYKKAQTYIPNDQNLLHN